MVAPPRESEGGLGISVNMGIEDWNRLPFFMYFLFRYNTQLVALRRELKSCKSKLADQSKQNMEYATRMDEYDKKFEESARKFSTVLQVRKCSETVFVLLLKC